MQRYHSHRRIAVFVLCLSLLAGLGVARAAEQTVMQIADEFRPQIIKATTPVVTALSYRALFTKLGRARLGQLKNDPSDMLAVQGMWEASKTIAPGAADGKLDPGGVKAFTDFFEKRMKVDMPPWFKETLMQGRIIPGTATVFSPAATPKYADTKAGIKAPEGTQITVDGDRYVITINGRSVKVDADLLNVNKKAPEMVTALITNKRTFIAVHEDAGFPYRLISVSTGTGKLHWQTAVWGAGRTVLGGLGFHALSMRLKDGQLFVFGVESHGAYIEALEASSGDNRFRFCTNYWFHFSEAWNLK